MPASPKLPRGLTAYVSYAATCSLAGWGLSWLGALHAFTLLPCLGLWALVVARRYRLRLRWHRRRLRPGLPAVYGVCALLVFLGGALHAPNNYDALSYRLPRMLHWVSARGWHWILTPNIRMNLSAAGTEWMQLPLLLCGSDRPLFLVNALGYLLLPGLIFSVARLCGVRARVAWALMWLLPCGYGLALQGGSIGNDLPAVVFALAAVSGSLIAARTRRLEPLWLAGICAALLTGVKASNLPLLLPIVVAAWPALPLLRERRWLTCAVALIMFGVSFAPSALLNLRYTGDWTGDPTDNMRLKVHAPLAGVIGNSLQLTAQSFAPPLLPAAHKLEARIEGSFPAALSRLLHAEFVHFDLGLGELPQEEASGLGLGVMLALLIGVVGRARRSQRHARAWWIGGATWLALLVFMLSLCSQDSARLTLAYQPLALLPLFTSANLERRVRRRWWQRLATLCAASALCGLMLTPARPLVPVRAALAKLLAANIARAQLARPQLVYETYALRNDGLASLHRHIPHGLARVGLLAGMNELEYSLWKGLKPGTVQDLWDGRTLALSAADFPEWNVIKASTWRQLQLGELERWAQPRGASLVAHEQIVSKVAFGAEEWWVIRLQP